MSEGGPSQAPSTRLQSLPSSSSDPRSRRAPSAAEFSSASAPTDWNAVSPMLPFATTSERRPPRRADEVALDTDRTPSPRVLARSSIPVATVSAVLDPEPTQIPFIFSPIHDLENCIATNIEWTYTGPHTPVEFHIVAVVTEGTDGAVPTVMPEQSLLEVDATLQSLPWTPSNYTPGFYTLGAYFVDYEITVYAPEFGISSNGTRIDCNAQPSSAPASSTATQSAGNTRAGIVAGGVIAVVALLITVTVVFLCVRRGTCPRLRRPRPRRPPPSPPMPDKASTWSGSENSLRAPPAPPHKLRLSAIEMPRAALPRLEPNRRQPSVQLSSPATPLAPQPSPTSPKTYAHSPTKPPSAYSTRKPTPSLDLLEELSAGVGGGGGMSPGGESFEVSSPIPSSATSKMYRGRDSGTSYHTQPPSRMSYQTLAMSRMSFGTQAPSEEAWRARASSVIDPHLFGAVKTMHAVVPDVPPLPPRKDGWDS
ncbi:hypothetical protein C2E23DRAFT_936723 [Lenzites betulinus]|nr:hypothetical protein C2E23DRAFT_936723 [Lenzites betulinus]